MNLLRDIITYVRRIIKSPSNAQISDALIIDYINRFWIMDVDARIQLFDLKTNYIFNTVPGIDRYNMPLYNVQSETPGSPLSNDIGMYPVYQGFQSPLYINGIQVPLQTQQSQYFNIWPNVTQQALVVDVGNGGQVYSFTLPVAPNNSNPVNTPVNCILRGHVDMAGIMATGINQDPPIGNTISNTGGRPNIPFSSIDPALFIYSTAADGSPVVVSDSGQFLTGNVNLGLLINQRTPIGVGLNPFGYSALFPGYNAVNNVVDYFTGQVNVTFPVGIPQGVNINAVYYFFQTGLPRAANFYNNVITLRSPPDRQYNVKVEAYLTPSAFFNTAAAIPFGYMAEYIARGAARKILSDTGDTEQLQFYEPFFREQETLVWKRSQRQFTATRSETIYSQGINQGQSGFNNIGGSTF